MEAARISSSRRQLVQSGDMARVRPALPGRRARLRRARDPRARRGREGGVFANADRKLDPPAHGRRLPARLRRGRDKSACEKRASLQKARAVDHHSGDRAVRRARGVLSDRSEKGRRQNACSNADRGRRAERRHAQRRPASGGRGVVLRAGQSCEQLSR